MPNSDFTVKRTAFKDNTSDYHINDQRVQYKEVAQLLRDEGVDLDHNRFLILQVFKIKKIKKDFNKKKL